MNKQTISICNEARKFYDLDGSRFCEFPIYGRARVLRVGEKDVLYQQAYSKDGPYVLVPGYMISSIFHEDGKKCCNVYPIKEKCERENIEKLLSERVRGCVNFWY